MRDDGDKEGTSWYKNRVRNENDGAVELEEPGWILVCRGCETPIRTHLRGCALARVSCHSPAGPGSEARMSVTARGLHVRRGGGRGPWGRELEPRRIRTGSARARCAVGCGQGVASGSGLFASYGSSLRPSPMYRRVTKIQIYIVCHFTFLSISIL